MRAGGSNESGQGAVIGSVDRSREAARCPNPSCPSPLVSNHGLFADHYLRDVLPATPPRTTDGLPETRAALQSLAAHVGHDGWIIAGYAPVELRDDASCHTCGGAHSKGEVLFRPVFERGNSPRALETLPTEDWLDCTDCVHRNVSVRAPQPGTGM